jgi:hypothetical protein
MLAILIAAAAGAYLHSLISIELPGPNCSALEILVETKVLARDVRWLYANCAALCAWVIATARACRHYCNAILIPWLAGYGVCLPLIPVLMLPRSPESLIDFDAFEDRITEGLPKFIA